MADEKSADKLMKQAEKCLRPAVMSMRFKPDWDEAYPLFEKAAVQYRVAGCPRKAIEAYEKAAHANVKGKGTAWHAAKHLEAASQLANELQDAKACADFAKQAADHYVTAGKAGTGAECLGRAARLLETRSPTQSGQLYMAALELYGKDPMASMANDMVSRGVGVQLKEQKWEDAATMLLQWAAICSDNKSIPYLCRAYLGVIVVYLYAGDAQAAWTSYQDFLDVEEFSNSAEAMSAENLMDGYRSADPAEVQRRLAQGRCWGNLDSAVARLAKQLPSKGVDLKGMASFFNRKMSDGTDPAEAAPEDEHGDLDLT